MMILVMFLVSSVLSDSSVSPFLFDGESSRMQLSGPIKVFVYQVVASNGTSTTPTLGSVIASIPVNVSATSVKGSSTSLKPGVVSNTLDIQFKNINSKGTNGTLTNLGLTLKMETDSSYWKLVDLSTSYTGQLTGSTKNFEGKGGLIVAPKPGYTNRKADAAFGRQYLTGGPKLLSWTCNAQMLLPNVTKAQAAQSVAIGVQFPGLALQPFGDKKATRFGANWDCDPIFSVGIWQFIFLGLFLLGILYWSIYMLSNLQTPVRFDDPKGAPLNVSTM